MTGTPADTQLEADRLKKLLEPTVASHNLYLEDVEVHHAGAQRIVHIVVDLLEGTDGVQLDTIAEVSRSVSEALDADPLDGAAPYDLEVSSPGVSRPLTELRHWSRNVGRMVKINMIGEENLTGRVMAVSADSITVIPELEVKKGMKAKQGPERVIEFSGIRRGNVEVEFTHINDVELEDIEELDIDEETEEA